SQSRRCAKTPILEGISDKRPQEVFQVKYSSLQYTVPVHSIAITNCGTFDEATRLLSYFVVCKVLQIKWRL
ncbi:unnamed protein product, partial [Ascophyllum nodosum]